MGIAHEPSGAKPSPCHNLTLGSIGRKYYHPGWCIVVAWVWAHERAVRFCHLLPVSQQLFDLDHNSNLWT
jgi:hypothetical protein